MDKETTQRNSSMVTARGSPIETLRRWKSLDRSETQSDLKLRRTTATSARASFCPAAGA